MCYFEGVLLDRTLIISETIKQYLSTQLIKIIVSIQNESSKSVPYILIGFKYNLHYLEVK